MQDKLRVALVHDWLTGMRGGEYVLEAIAEIFPKSDLYTLIHVPGSVSPTLTTLKIHTSWLQKIPGIEKRYRHFLPLMPQAVASLDVSSYDLVISSSHCVAKGVSKGPEAVHVSYVHAPMRYMWERFDDYFGPGRASAPVRLAASILRPRLQSWDRATSSSDRIDSILANSAFVAGQIRAHYGREATVLHPFVECERFGAARVPGRNYLMVGAFAPNKRVDLAIEAFNRLKLPLLIVGSGQEREKLQRRAGPNIEFLGSLSNAAIADLYAKCRAFIFPGIEDFGITPLEAMAAGAPVIAFGQGGALETVTSDTGIFFMEPTSESLVAAVQRLESGELNFDPALARARAAQFTRAEFQGRFVDHLKLTWQAAGKDLRLLEDKLRGSWAAK